MPSLLSVAALHGLIFSLVGGVVALVALYRDPGLLLNSGRLTFRNRWVLLWFLVFFLFFGHLVYFVVRHSDSVFLPVFLASCAFSMLSNFLFVIIFDLGLVWTGRRAPFLLRIVNIQQFKDPKWYIRTLLSSVGKGLFFSLLVAGLAWLFL